MSVRKSLMIATVLFGGTAGAMAQGNPSADQIINSLRPSGGMMGGTRGIRPVTPAAPSAAAPSASPQVAPAATAGANHAVRPPAERRQAAAPADAAPSVNLSVQFASNSAELTPAAMTTLSALGTALASNTLETYRFRIEGHTDTAGSPEVNKTLSQRRAQAVVTFLASRFHIDPSRLDAVGMGEDGLLVQTPPNTAEPRNRRVQIINLGA